MLDDRVFSDKLQELVDLFPTWTFDVENARAVRSFYKRFQHLSNQDFSRAVDKFINTSQFNPTISGLKACVTETFQVDDLEGEYKI